MNDTHATIIRCMGRYRIMLPDVAELLAPGADADKMGKALEDEGLIERMGKRKKLALCGNKVPYWKLTTKGCREACVPEERASLSATSLNRALAVLWFCHCSSVPRVRVEPEEVKELVGVGAKVNVAWVIEDRKETPVLWQCYVVGTDPDSALKRSTGVLADIKKSPKLAAFAEGRQLGIALLAPTPSACSTLKEAVADLGKRVPITVSLGPSDETIFEALEEWRKKRKKGGAK